MKYIYKFLVFFLIPFLSIAQNNYKPGYIVTPNGDTVTGFINYREWSKAPAAFNFRKNFNAGQTENYSVKNARAFGVAGLEYYQRFGVTISQDRVDVGKLETRPDSITLTDTVFLRSIAQGGHLSLFSYTDDIKKRFYILETGASQPLELAYHAYYNPDASASVQYINRFRTQLQNLAQKYNVNISDQILHAEYNEGDLLKAVTLINGSSSTQFVHKNLFGARFFAGLGVNSNHLKFDGQFSFPESSVISPKISVGVDLLPNKNVQQLFLRLGLEFTSSAYRFNNTTNGRSATFNFDQALLSVIPQICYNIYNTDLLKIFLNAGASINIASYSQYKLEERVSGFPPTTYNNYQLEKNWVSFPIKAGVLLNKNLEIYVGYSPSANFKNMSTSDYSLGSLVTYQAGINYLFGE